MSSSESDNANQQKVTKEFKDKVLRWVSLDDELRNLRKKTKEINKEKKTNEEFILNFLESVDEKVKMNS